MGDILRFSRQSDGAVTAVSRVRDQERPEGVMVRHHFRLRNPSTTSLTLTAAFRQLVIESSGGRGAAAAGHVNVHDAPNDASKRAR